MLLITFVYVYLFCEAELHIKSAVRWPTALVIGAEVMSIGGDVTLAQAGDWRYAASHSCDDRWGR